MAKDYFERNGEYREFDSEKNRITSVGFLGEGNFYYSVNTTPTDIHFEGALLHEKMNVKRTMLSEQDSNILLSATNENDETTTNLVKDNMSKTFEVGENHFTSIKANVLNRLQNL